MYNNIILETVNNVIYEYSHRYRLWRSHQIFNVVFVGLLVQLLYILICMLKNMLDIILLSSSVECYICWFIGLHVVIHKLSVVSHSTVSNPGIERKLT